MKNKLHWFLMSFLVLITSLNVLCIASDHEENVPVGDSYITNVSLFINGELVDGFVLHVEPPVDVECMNVNELFTEIEYAFVDGHIYEFDVVFQDIQWADLGDGRIFRGYYDIHELYTHTAYRDFVPMKIHKIGECPCNTTIYYFGNETLEVCDC